MRGWQYRPGQHQRDLRLDFLRGYLVFVMTINHLKTFPAWTRPLTGAGALWITALAGFILVSGVVLGMLYRRRVKTRGWHWSISQVVKRSLQLYLVAVVCHFIMANGDYVLRLLVGRPSGIHTDYHRLVISILFQQRESYLGVDLLPLYIILLPVGLVAVYLLERRKWHWLLLGSAALWLGHRFDQQWLVFFDSSLNVASWQLLYVAGVLIGTYREEIAGWRSRLPLPPWLTSTLLIVPAFAILAISYRVRLHGLWQGVGWFKKAEALAFGGPGIGMGSVILAVMALAAFVELLSRFWGVFERLLGWLFIPLGQNALAAYVIQGFLAYAVIRLPGFPFPDHDPLGMGFLHLAAVLWVWAMTHAIVRWQSAARARRHGVRGRASG